jgi:hypothetical protein
MCVSQSLFAIASPFGFGADGHVELGISEFQVWHHAGQGVPDPDVKRMGFFITTSEAQTLLEFDLSQVLCLNGSLTSCYPSQLPCCDDTVAPAVAEADMLWHVVG